MTRQSLASELIEAARHTFPEQSRTAAVSYEAENVPAATDAVHTNQLGGPARQIHNFVFKLNTWRPTEDLLLRQKVRWLWEGSPCFAFISTFYWHQAQVIVWLLPLYRAPHFPQGLCSAELAHAMKR